MTGQNKDGKEVKLLTQGVVGIGTGAVLIGIGVVVAIVYMVITFLNNVGGQMPEPPESLGWMFHFITWTSILLFIFGSFCLLRVVARIIINHFNFEGKANQGEEK